MASTDASINDPYGTNAATYGGIVDSYANKYGIPTDIFRQVIGGSSGFDPTYNSSTGKGIANINVGSGVSGVNPFDIGQSLDIAAQYVSSAYNSTGSWGAAADEYLGANGANSVPSTTPSASDTAISNAATDTGTSADTPGSKNILSLTIDDIIAELKLSAYSASLFIIGILLIVATIWHVVSTNGAK